MKYKKNIPNPIIKVGYSTKLNGEMSCDIDGSKVKKMKAEDIQVLLDVLQATKKKICTLRGGDFKVGNHVLTPLEYNRVVDYINSGRLLGAVKEYKGITGEGLKQSKDAIEVLRDRIRISEKN